MTNLELARNLHAEGFCVLPLLPGGKRPAIRWKRLQDEMPTDRELVYWFATRGWEPGIVTGAISGIMVIDCDSPEAVAACEAAGIASVMSQRTSRGRHYVYRYAGERNTVRLHGMPGVDRRGEGGYVRAYADAARWCRGDVLDAGYSPEAAATLEDQRQPCDHAPQEWSSDAEELSWDAATQSWVEPEAVG